MNNKIENNNTIITGEILMNMKVEQLPYLVDGLIPKTGLACLAGSSDTGKSSLLRQLGMHICSGKKDFLGFGLNSRYRRVLYISTEDDSTAMAYLLNKYDGLLKPEELKGLLFLFDTMDYFDKIHALLKQNSVDAVIVYTFTDLFNGQMNASNEVRRYLNNYSNIAEQYQCAVIFLHHTGKRTEELPPSKNNLIGSQGFEGKMRLVMELRKDLDDPDYRHLCIVKGNYIPEKEKQNSYMLAFQDMRFENTGKRVAFSDLAPEQLNRSAYPDHIVGKVKALVAEKVPYREVAEQITKDGYKMGKSTVANIAKDCPPVHDPLVNLDSGQDETNTSNNATSVDAA